MILFLLVSSSHILRPLAHSIWNGEATATATRSMMSAFCSGAGGSNGRRLLRGRGRDVIVNKLWSDAIARPGAMAASPSVRTKFSSSHDDYDDCRLAPTLSGVRRELRSKRERNRSASSTAVDARERSVLLADGGLATEGLRGLDPRLNARHAPMVYHDRYSCPDWPARHTFPMAKFEETANSLLNDPDEFLLSEGEEGEEENDDDGTRRPLVLSREHFHRPLPASTFPNSFLSPPLCPSFVRAFLSASLSYEERRLVGFREETSRPELIERTMLEVAGTVLAAQLAMRHGLASNVAGGTHHAEGGRGKGYTILNDLAVAARLMTWKEEDDDGGGDGGLDDDDDRRLLREFYRGEAAPDRVLVVDCDVHQGDGTATFAYEGGSLRGRLFTLDVHAANNYPHPKERSTYDVGLRDGCDDDDYLSALKASLDRALREVKPGLVLYNAGVDVFHSDKLGRLSLSWEGMRERDLHVIRTCVDGVIPVAAVVGGGYDDDVGALGRRHALVHRACAQVWRERRMWSQTDPS